MLPHPRKIQLIRTPGAPRRIPPRLIRRPIDAYRLRVFLESESYGALLLVEVASEKARDALRANDHAAAAGSPAISPYALWRSTAPSIG